MYLVLSPQENKHQHRVSYNRANGDVRCQQREAGASCSSQKDAETIKKHQFGKIKVRQVRLRPQPKRGIPPTPTKYQVRSVMLLLLYNFR